MAEANYLIARAPSGEVSERSTEEIRRDIEAKRGAISETADRLGDRLQQTFDWRTYIADYPYVALGVAAGLGFLLSGIFKPRPTPRERIMDAVAESVEELSTRFRENIPALQLKKSGTGSTIKAAATAMVTKAAVNYLKDKLQLPPQANGNFESQAPFSSGASPARRADNY